MRQWFTKFVICCCMLVHHFAEYAMSDSYLDIVLSMPCPNSLAAGDET